MCFVFSYVRRDYLHLTQTLFFPIWSIYHRSSDGLDNYLLFGGIFNQLFLSMSYYTNLLLYQFVLKGTTIPGSSLLVEGYNWTGKLYVSFPGSEQSGQEHQSRSVLRIYIKVLRLTNIYLGLWVWMYLIQQIFITMSFYFSRETYRPSLSPC